MKFDNVFNKIINEMKYISSPNASYKINDDAMIPIVFNDVCICMSALNKDLFHVLDRINKRSNKKYDISTVITIIKRYIKNDPDFKKLFYKGRDIYSCSIQSKEFNLIKVLVTFEKNNARDIFSDDIQRCKYFCFIYTVLDNNMIEHNNDIQLIVESDIKQICVD